MYSSNYNDEYTRVPCKNIEIVAGHAELGVSMPIAFHRYYSYFVVRITNHKSNVFNSRQTVGRAVGVPVLFI